MNECFFMGKVIDVGNFKFIVSKNKKLREKSQIEITLKAFDKNNTIIKFVAFNNVADYILRNNFLQKTVIVNGKLRTNYIEIYYIKEVL